VKTELFIDIPAKSYNLKTLVIKDTSHYCDDVIENYIIEVLPVHKSTWTTFYVQKEFTLVLNSSNLGYKKVADVKELIDLPDGVYEIKQSYKPNIKNLSHYYHMRVVAIDMKYNELLCSHFSEECKKDERTFNEETLHLMKIRQYIDAAVYEVIERHDKEAGIRLYNQAVELIKQFEDECSCV